MDLCLPGFLSSCHGTSDLVASLLSPSGVTGDNPLLLEATNRWSSKLPLPSEDQQHVQHKWDELLYKQQHSSLLNSTLNDQSKARLLSVASAKADAWLNVLPVPSLGTKLVDESLCIALSLLHETIHCALVSGDVRTYTSC